MEGASVAGGAYIGLDNGSGRKRTYKLHEMVGEKSKFQFKYVAWDGCTPTPIEDRKNRVIAILAGHPDDHEKWSRMERQASAALESARGRIRIPKKERTHRRGRFPTLRTGVSHGNGSTRPINLGNSDANAAVIQELNHLQPFRRLAGFASCKSFIVCYPFSKLNPLTLYQLL
ncbi:hypothetical protein GALMADRAFT_70525 [Galerina marginata CBS 339.88]|uniref:Uncharacterized protein n=1 Tax=Galerina marginata (strain CBS 339.88) TaxID=685588 RepID=A0A067SUU2_GALM3|nr:hypothetical protein GALMADRAFT_70525 [Galerina marginata CBS 339.88]